MDFCKSAYTNLFHSLVSEIYFCLFPDEFCPPSFLLRNKSSFILKETIGGKPSLFPISTPLNNDCFIKVLTLAGTWKVFKSY